MRFLDELGEDMPLWLPLSPPDTDPSDECDLRMEEDCFDFMYEIEQMSEARLPHIIHEIRRPLAEKQKQNVLTNDLHLHTKEKDPVYDAVAKCLSMPPSEAAIAASPAYTENSFSMDDTSQDAKILEPGTSSGAQVADSIAQQGPLQGPLGPPIGAGTEQPPRKRERRQDKRQSQKSQPPLEVIRATTPPPAWREAANYDGAEWNIIEDNALLQSVQASFANLQKVERQPEMEGMLLNWDLVAQDVNKHTKFYRSARQCSMRYQMFVRPKENGQLVASDPITKRTMKVDLSTTELSHLRKGRSSTVLQYQYDYGTLTDKKHTNRFKTVERSSSQRSVQFWRGPRDLASRKLTSVDDGIPPHHVTKLQDDFDIRIGLEMDAESLVTMTDEALMKYETEKRKLSTGREKRPPHNPQPRFHTLVERPYAVPISEVIPAAPLRRDMVIAVPPLVPAPPVVAPSHPPPPSQSILQQQQSQQQQQNLGAPPQQQQSQQPLPSIHHLGTGGGASSMGPLPPIGNLQHHHHHHHQHQNPQNPAPIQMRQQQMHQSEGPGSGGGPRDYHPPMATIQRRTVSGTNMQYLSGGPPQQAQSYVVMGASGGPYASSQATAQGGAASEDRVQGAQQGGQGGPQGGPGGAQGAQGAVPQQGPPQQQQQRVQYVPQGAARGPGGPGGSGASGNYNTLVMQRNGRVVRPAGTIGPGGAPNRIYMDQRHHHPHHQYPQNVVPVRVMPAGQQPQRMISGQRRQPVAGTVAAMVMPHRTAGGQIRTMQRAPAYGPNSGAPGAQGPNGGPNGGPGGPQQGPQGPQQQQQQRINVMVQAQNMRAGAPGGGPGGPGVPAIRRQLVGHRQIQRVGPGGGIGGGGPGGGHSEGIGAGGGPAAQGPQVAQVVVAPPQGMQPPPVLHMQRPSYHHQQQQQQAPPTSTAHGAPPREPPPASSSEGGPGGPPSKL